MTFGVDHVVSRRRHQPARRRHRALPVVLVFDGDDRSPGAGHTQSPQVAALPDGQPAAAVRRARPARRPGGAPLVPALRRRRHPARRSPATSRCSRCWPSLLVPLTFFVLWRTAFGLRLRSVRREPRAPPSRSASNVYRMKYAAVVVSGALAGLGGAFLVDRRVERLPRGADRRPRLHRPGRHDLRQLAAGRHWPPAPALFGYADALQLRRGGDVGPRAAAARRRCCSWSSAIRLSCAAARMPPAVAGAARSRVARLPLVRLTSTRVPGAARRLHPPPRHAAGARPSPSQRLRPPAADGSPTGEGSSS